MIVFREESVIPAFPLRHSRDGYGKAIEGKVLLKDTDEAERQLV